MFTRSTGPLAPSAQAAAAALSRACLESLESRLLFHVEPAAALPNTFGNPGGADACVGLGTRYGARRGMWARRESNPHQWLIGPPL